MKPLPALLVAMFLAAFLAPALHPQTSEVPTAQQKPPHKPATSVHASLADQRMCYEQTQKYVARLHDSEAAEAAAQKQLPAPHTWNEPTTTDSFDYFWGAHYDAPSKTCYVEYGRTVSWTGALKWGPDGIPTTDAWTVTSIAVDDAFEGKNIAGFSENDIFEGAKLTKSDVNPCDVNGEKCSERAVWNGLLWNLIPAFQPVDCTTDGKPCPRK